MNVKEKRAPESPCNEKQKTTTTQQHINPEQATSHRPLKKRDPKKKKNKEGKENRNAK
jgi:hypothetical protein